MKWKFKSKLAALAAGVGSAMACACGAATFSITPIADAFVATGTNGEFTASNFGGAGALAVAAPGLPLGEFQTVLKFDLSSVRSSLDAQFGSGLWTVQSISLQLTAAPHSNPIFNNVATGAFGISLMQNNSWVEGTGTGGIPSNNGISFSSLQTTFRNDLIDQPLGTFSFSGATSGINNYSLELNSSLVGDLQGGSDLSLRLFAADDQVSYLMDSRTGGASGDHPFLVITAVPEPSSILLGIAGLAVLSGARRAGSRRA